MTAEQPPDVALTPRSPPPGRPRPCKHHARELRWPHSVLPHLAAPG